MRILRFFRLIDCFAKFFMSQIQPQNKANKINIVQSPLPKILFFKKEQYFYGLKIIYCFYSLYKTAKDQTV